MIGKNAEYIRLGLQQNRFDFGSAVQRKTGHWSYNIIKSKFYEYAGIKDTEDKIKEKEVQICKKE